MIAEPLLDEFVGFFDGLPPPVRADLSFMLVTLSDENFIHDVEAHYESTARRMFDARTRVGRIGNLVNAVSVFDVYFAMDARTRFEPRGPAARAVVRNSTGKPADGYAEQLQAIQSARRAWDELRRSILTPEAIAAALIPPDSSAVRYRRSRPATFNDQSIGAKHGTVS